MAYRRRCALTGAVVVLAGWLVATSAGAKEAEKADFLVEHRAALSPSALHPPGGTLLLDLNGPAPGFTAAPIDLLMIRATALRFGRHFRLVAAQVQGQLLRTQRSHIAVFGSVLDARIDASYTRRHWAAGAVVTFRGQHAHSGWLSLLGGFGLRDQVQDTSPLHQWGWFLGVNALVPLRPRLAATAEAIKLGVRDHLVSVAGRVAVGRLNLDVGLVRPSIEGIDLDALPVWPWLALSFRALPWHPGS